MFKVTIHFTFYTHPSYEDEVKKPSIKKLFSWLVGGVPELGAEIEDNAPFFQGKKKKNSILLSYTVYKFSKAFHDENGVSLLSAFVSSAFPEVGGSFPCVFACSACSSSNRSFARTTLLCR